jgi:CRISPR/Cas system-associated exonuclease Cas4 (RecB family)
VPHTSFLCPDPVSAELAGGIQVGKRHSVAIDACLGCAKSRIARTCDFNHALLRAMVEEQDTRISPTRLGKCPRQVALKRQYSYAVDPYVAFWRVRGTIFHYGFEQLRGEHECAEMELTRELDGISIAGRADVIQPDLGLISDWKTTKYIRKDHAPREDHIGQLSVYAWLARPLGWDCTVGELMYVDMGKPRRLVVDLWPDEQTEAWMRTRLPALQSAYGDESRLAPILVGEDAWMCKHCEVAEICATIGELEAMGEY